MAHQTIKEHLHDNAEYYITAGINAPFITEWLNLVVACLSFVMLSTKLYRERKNRKP
jgi:hypothetical protein